MKAIDKVIIGGGAAAGVGLLVYGIRRALAKGEEFTCPECDTSFATYDELLTHMAAEHPGVDPPSPPAYPCPFCDAVFGTPEELAAHIITEHPAEPPPPPGERERIEVLVPYVARIVAEGGGSADFIKSFSVTPAAAPPGETTTITIEFVEPPVARRASVDIKIRYRDPGGYKTLARERFFPGGTDKSGVMKDVWEKYTSGDVPSVISYEVVVPEVASQGHYTAELAIEISGAEGHWGFTAHNHFVILKPYRLWHDPRWAGEEFGIVDIVPQSEVVTAGSTLPVTVYLSGPTGAEGMGWNDARMKGWWASVTSGSPRLAGWRWNSFPYADMDGSGATRELPEGGAWQRQDMSNGNVMPPIQRMTVELAVGDRLGPMGINAYVRTPNGLSEVILSWAFVVVP